VRTGSKPIARALASRGAEGRVNNGGILLSVHCDRSEWTKKAKEILERTWGFFLRAL